MYLLPYRRLPRVLSNRSSSLRRVGAQDAERNRSGLATCGGQERRGAFDPLPQPPGRRTSCSTVFHWAIAVTTFEPMVRGPSLQPHRPLFESATTARLGTRNHRCFLRRRWSTLLPSPPPILGEASSFVTVTRQQFDAIIEDIHRLIANALPREEAMEAPGDCSNSQQSPTVAWEAVLELHRAADEAHALLEQLAPILSPRHHRHRHRRQKDPDSTSSLLVPPPSDAAGVDHPVTWDPAFASRACQDVLAAWASVVRAGYYWRRESNRTRGRRAKEGDHRILRGIPQRTQYLLDRLEDALLSGAGASPRPPSMECYDSVLEAWAYSTEHLRGSAAERAFQRLLRSHPKPSGKSQRLVVRAWALSDDPRAAFTATGHLMKMLRQLERGNADMEPAMSDYHAVLQAWTRADDRTSPNKAHSVLKLMEHVHRQGLSGVRPDLACYRAVLQAAAQRPMLPDLGPLVDGILSQMWHQRLIVPDAACFAAAIRTWKHAALLAAGSSEADARASSASSVSSSPPAVALRASLRERSIRRTRELLQDMKVAHQQSGDSSVSATIDCVHDVLEALALSDDPQVLVWTDQALLNLTQPPTSPHPNSVAPPLPHGPNFDTYRLHLLVCRTSAARSPELAEAALSRAESILKAVADSFPNLARRLSPRQLQRQAMPVFAAYVRVCSAAVPTAESDGTRTFRRALAGVEGMRSLPVAAGSPPLKPDADTYAALLEACRRLLAQGTERQKLVEQVFRMCCSDGMVDDRVLHELRVATSEDHYTELVVSASEVVEGTKTVPESWTANALGGRVLTAQGRRVAPLSVEGRHTVTLAMREYQMRRLRDHRNRNLLQGGRLCNLQREKGNMP